MLNRRRRQARHSETLQFFRIIFDDIRRLLSAIASSKTHSSGAKKKKLDQKLIQFVEDDAVPGAGKILFNLQP